MRLTLVFTTFHAAFSESLYQIAEIGSQPEQRRDLVTIDEILERNEKLVSDYVGAVGKLEHHRLSHFLHPEFEYRGAVNFRSAADYIEMIKDHANSPVANVLLRNEVKSIFADEHECCVIYESVTAFPHRTVPFVEWIKIKDNRIASTEVKFNQHRMKLLMQEMNRERNGST